MSYLGRSSEFGVRSRYIYTAAGSETSISGADDNNNSLSFTDGAYVDVYLNGVLLVPAVDYNTTTANTIGGLSALSASDVVEVVVYDVFNVADTVPASTGGTFNGNITATAFYGDGSNLTGIESVTKSATAPTSPADGDLWYDTTTKILKVYSNTDWVAVGDQSAQYDIEYLVVGGGGGGGTAPSGAVGDRGGAGGGGAGGYVSAQATIDIGTAYTITLGSGGSADNNGTDSTAFGTAAVGGGAGGRSDSTTADQNGSSGGSGGGAGATTFATASGGSGTSGQGNDGGNAASGNYGGAGGGGASAVGASSTGIDGVAGGNGSTWFNGTTYAGGGGGGCGAGSSLGGTGGSGGGGTGGDGSTSSAATAGTANTGGGGGGGGDSDSPEYLGASGGSGVVVIRYFGTQRGTGGTVTYSDGYTYHTFTSSGSYTA